MQQRCFILLSFKRMLQCRPLNNCHFYMLGVSLALHVTDLTLCTVLFHLLLLV
jgi:hypothetical protein